MKRVLFNPLALSLCAAVLVGSLTACVPLVIGGAAAGGSLVATDRRTSGAQLEDEGIELRGTSRIRSNLGERGHVNLTSYNRQVLLTGDVKVINTTPEVAVSKVIPTAAFVASVVLGTELPPAMATFKPSVGVEADTVVSAAIGFNRPTVPFGPGAVKVLASATVNESASELDPLPYQVSPRTAVTVANCVGCGPTCKLNCWQLPSNPLEFAHKARAPEVDSTVSTARRT